LTRSAATPTLLPHGHGQTRAAQIEHLREEFRKRGIRKVKLGGFDVDGVLRGKYVSLDKFWGVADGGLGFCDVIFGWDSGDVLYDNATVTGWHSGYPDVHATVDLSTYRIIPWEEGTAAFLLDFDVPVSPRGVLQKVEQKARAMVSRSSARPSTNSSSSRKRRSHCARRASRT